MAYSGQGTGLAQQLAHGVWFIADFITPGEARAWVDLGYSAGFEPTVEHKSATVGNDQAFLIDPVLSTDISTRLTRALTAHLPDSAQIVLDEMLEIYRYQGGQEISTHHDAATEVRPGLMSTHTLVVYLSRPGRGGQTVFPRLNLSFAPWPRGALLFHQSHEHFGDRVDEGVKYILRTAAAAPTGWV
jgi:hypothetical protein